MPLLHVFGTATAPPASLLSRLLPPGAAAALPQDFLQSAHAGRLAALDGATEHATADMRRFSLAAMAWACDLDAAFAPQR